MISPQAQNERQRLFANRKPEDQAPAEARLSWEAEARETHVLPEGTTITPASADGVAGLWVTPANPRPDAVILHLHGGGYIAGSAFIYRRFAAHTARAARLPVFLPDYALAPEHPFPAGLEDAMTAFTWLQKQGFDPSRIVLVGDSAGGGLALSLLLKLRETGAAMPGAVALVSPWTDLTVSSPSYQSLRDADPVISQHRLRVAGRHYAGSRNPADPMLSPLFADLKGLPPMLIQVGSDEMMLDDSVLFAERARAAGVAVSLQVWAGMWHVFHQHVTALPEAGDGILALADYLVARLA